ncbi:unnamed protein product [Auanema sp. JU1783]|nr:unnamed protein product [Auanema sp. JU1783]
MAKRFQDKVVIVTGSSNGIGRATAQKFAEEGAKVTITGRNSVTLKQTRDILIEAGSTEDCILEIIGDLVDMKVQEKLINDTVAKFGGIDVLINNAGGVAPDMTNTENFLNIECFDYVINLNTRAVVNLMNLAIPHLIRSKGEIINVSSIAAFDFAWTSVPYYAASKAALDQMTRAYAVRYIQDDVRVNSVNPGAVLTAIMEKQGIDASEMFEAIKEDRTKIPVGRIGQPKDIAETIAFLADRKTSGFIVGQCLVVDGGTSICNTMSTEAIKTSDIK